MSSKGPRINREELVMVAVAGQIAHPVGAANPYRIGNDGVPRVLPATGGIVLNHRIGDRCVGLAGDHIEPGVALHNNGREVVGARNGPNRAFITYACVGNRARVVNGPCAGQWGLVTGKHGGVDHVIADFPTTVLRRLNIGDRIQVYSCGLGLRLPDHPEVDVFNCAPSLLERWGIVERAGRLHVPVTHLVPARIMGSGLGKNTVWRGDYDIQLFDRPTRQRYQLGGLRFGDLIAIRDAYASFGPSYRQGWITLGVIVHGDSTASGHGPGVAPLLSGPARVLQPQYDANANLAAIYGVRTPAAARTYSPLSWRERPGGQGTRRVAEGRRIPVRAQ
ncbi:DUF4438 domain-containing protein [Methylococcus sp. EFPC2]|uniref:DUF4438 domain-containing protein n=1 Tax=Methylococcus sp. EFPC2 TaxID=2812648 RepID=UPI001967BD0A|nr:DUF4438 domain-containing protein [Methylococcus sp. EFPC2]QSA97012.1 DUF4438 domain-containing protein [Methylococcus sp. EFPC2]